MKFFGNVKRNRLLKPITGLLSLLMFLQLYVITMLSNTSGIWSESPYESIYKNLFTVVDYVSGGLNIGSETVPPNGRVYSNDSLYLYYQFKASDIQVSSISDGIKNTSSDYSVYIEIPDGLKCIENDSRPIFLSYDDAIDENGDPIQMQFGTLNFDNTGKGVYLKFEGYFWQQILPGDAITKAEIYLSCQLDMEDVGFNAVYPIKIEENNTINIIIGDPATPPSVSKTGSFDNNQFKWVITFNPGSSEYIYPVTLVDVFENKFHEFINSVSVKQGLKTFVEGTDFNYTCSDGVNSDGETITSVEFEITSKPSGVVTITYYTALTAEAFGNGEYEKDTVVTNTVYLKDKKDDTLGTDNPPAEATVTVQSDGKVWIKKEITTIVSSKTVSSKTIDWKITVNTWGLNYDELMVTDEMSKGLILDINSIKINNQPLTAGVEMRYTTSDGWTTTTSNINGAAEFRFALPVNSDGSCEPVYTITYTTNVDESYLAYNKANEPSFTNKAYLDIEWSSHYNSTPPKPKSEVGPIGLNNHIIRKSFNTYNRKDHTITWTITLNPYGLYVKNGEIIDDLIFQNLPIGLKYKTYSSNDTTGEVSFSRSSDGTGLTITVGEIGTETVTIWLVTELTDKYQYGSNKNYSNFDNTANFEGTVEINGNDIDITDEATAGGSFYTSVLAKAAVAAYDYNTHTITWRISVNANEMPMPDAVIVDTIPQYQNFIDNSIRWGTDSAYKDSTVLSEIEIANNVKFETLTGTDAGKTRLTIDLKNRADNRIFYIYYQTKVDVDNNPEFLSKTSFTARNDVKMTRSDGFSDVTTSATTSITNKVITKNGTVYNQDNSISYSVNVNPNGMTLSDCTLTDEFSAGLRLDLKSVKLHKGTVSTSGVVSKTSTAASDGIWSWSYEAADKNVLNSKNKLIVSFSEVISDRYVLEYTCFASSGGSFDNTVTLEGATFSNGINKASIMNKQLNGSGTASRMANLSVTKQDSKNNSAIKNVEFCLYTKIAGFDTVVDRAVTDNDGKITFRNLTPGLDYRIEEAASPNGYSTGAYVYDENDTDFHDISDYTFNLTANTTKNIIITNERKLFPSSDKINIVKVNDYGKYLEGAEFSLTDDEDNNKSVGTLYSGSDGIIRLPDNLTFGTYTLQETAAPESHLLNDEPFKLVVDSDGNYELHHSDGTQISQNNEGEIEILNKWDKSKTELQIKKLDELTQKPLKEVEFKLYYTENGIDTEIETGATDSDGTLIFRDLEPYLDYWLRETENDATDGYNTDKTTVSSDGQTNAVSINGFSISFVKAERHEVTVYNSRVVTDIIFFNASRYGTVLPNVRFTLMGIDPPYTDTQPSGSDGIIIFKDVPFGEYELVETDPPPGNYKPLPGLFKITIDKDKKIEIIDPDGNIITPPTDGNPVQITNEWNTTETEIKITKKDGKTRKPLKDVEFEIYYIENSAENIAGKGVTDSDGILVFSGLEPYREYRFRETEDEAVYGYNINETAVVYGESDGVLINDFSFKVVDAETYELTVYNSRVETDAVFVKKNDFGHALENVSFELTDIITGNTYTEVSDENGVFIFNKLAFGDYTLIEKGTPLNHLPSNIKFYVTINKDKSITVTNSNGETLVSDSFEPIEIINAWDIKQDNISITKLDESTGLPLEGVVFKLYTEESGVDVYITEGSTDSDGVLIFYNLEPYRIYSIEEITPEGYKNQGKVVAFDGEETYIDFGSNDRYYFSFMESINKKITVYNYRNTAEVVFTKVNEQDKTLSGAEFKLKGIDIFYEDIQISGSDGKVMFKDIPFGNYVLTETKEPEGYLPNTEKYSVEIDKNGVYVIKSQDGMVLNNSSSGNAIIVNEIIPPVTTSPNYIYSPIYVITPVETKSPDDSGDSKKPGDPDNPDSPNNPAKTTHPGNPDNPDKSNIINNSQDPNVSVNPYVPNSPDILINPENPQSNTAENPLTGVVLPVKILLLIAFLGIVVILTFAAGIIFKKRKNKI